MQLREHPRLERIAEIAARTRIAAVVVSLAILGWGASARGQAAAEPGVSDADRARAIALFDRSAAAYEAGHFEEAADLLEEAYALYESPTLLFNLARAYENLGRREDAITTYERYLDGAGDPPDRASVEARIARLRRELEERAQLHLALDEARRRPAPPTGVDWAPWVLAGSGAAVLIGAIVLGGIAEAQYASALTEDVSTSARALELQAGEFAIGANVLFAFGGGLALAGLVWGIVSLTLDPSESAARLSLFEPVRF